MLFSEGLGFHLVCFFCYLFLVLINKCLASQEYLFLKIPPDRKQGNPLTDKVNMALPGAFSLPPEMAE